ncbi:MAG: hypothetical protein Q8K75_09685 [Chlamydiales bacterium]|nr:hypothetical protein [Chlamydiales bacterium]
MRIVSEIKKPKNLVANYVNTRCIRFHDILLSWEGEILHFVAVHVFVLAHLLGLGFRQGMNPCLQTTTTQLNQNNKRVPQVLVAIWVIDLYI